MSARFGAILHALRGARTLIATQPHARFHLLASLVVLGLGVAIRITAFEWALLVLSISVVWVSEALNTSIEFLADELTLEWRERIKFAKDIAAFAVLAGSIGAVAIGLLVFIPHLIR